MERKLEITSDGSPTLYVPSLDEHYHSVKGALAESRHIFIGKGFDCHPSSAPDVLEIGFGTGLNAFLTLLAAEEAGKPVHYTALELYPLEAEWIACLDYPREIAPGRYPDYERLHTSEWGKEVAVTPSFFLYKWNVDFVSATLPEDRYDLVYFDAFAPEKQPEMWTQEIFDRLYAALRKKGILTTYCSKGIVRRMLQASGFVVERLPGPPNGKREILRAIK